MSIYIIQTQAPDHPSSWHGQDMYLALATMELNPQLILLGDALRHLQTGADAQRDGRSLQKRYALLDLYECPAPLVVTNDVEAGHWVADVRAISSEELTELLAAAGKVLRF
ncbi:DsrE family protein [Pseudidiomarina insulisalsae]|uniref:Uncharacterized protein n=1 Tax=Pseudidiomarina insulisalsae TaxID=575789 RepID=A0A432YH34_9GAMM|nr:DsrE family protein [Pseudidiomarina insulisalsae]RUO60269.1 hypothetical protein CWI71_07615 [Pseudidiomarina insulisalsae]